MTISELIIPALFAFVMLYGCFKKIDVFSEFTEGVKEGLGTILGIFPSLFCLVVAVGAFRASGGAQLLSDLLAPFFSLVGFPSECGSLVLLRPLSGSGALALFDGILTQYGPDSYAGRTASVILGSSETTFYTLSVYFSAVKAKNTRYALPAAIIGDITVFLLSSLTVRLFLY